MLQEGHVYVGVPPLYKLEVGRKAQYCYDDAELAEKTQGLTPGSYSIQRFKVRLRALHLVSYQSCLPINTQQHARTPTCAAAQQPSDAL